MNGAYAVTVLPRAQKVLAAIRSPDFERVRDAIRKLSSTPRPSGCKKLTGRDGWRIRVGRFRVIYEIDDMNRLINVLDVGDRRDVYR